MQAERRFYSSGGSNLTPKNKSPQSVMTASPGKVGTFCPRTIDCLREKRGAWREIKFPNHQKCPAIEWPA